MDDLPELVRRRARAAGGVGERWLAALPSVIDDLAERWGLAVGAPFAGGTAGCVLAVTRSDGTEAVLKVGLPSEVVGLSEFELARAAHEHADGRGCATLLETDGAHRALLLERLGPNLHESGHDLDEVLDVIADTLLEFWRPLPVRHPFPTGADKALWLAEMIVDEWRRSGEACERAIVDRAVEFCHRRAGAFDPSDVVLVHGDAHGWNTLRAGSAHKFVDPEGVASSRAHDLAVPMREYHEPLLAGDTPTLLRARATRLATRCAVDPDEVWEWGFIERVSTGLLNLRDFDDGSGEGFLEVARRCL
ncbi:MAG: aminoglycoside phosphotransferase family protein [Actinomycetota bacterium]